ncbi:uncharacterized protein LOC102206882 [Pundamilia nyererei]|uniref:Uncharacterized protein LOC102206882 n=1 Tax=Pundamilia nyererei TaxID=303518 RepID=A0A9Y6JI01_9CICH|nr:PREDICTED: uncharacterized protein LOC102206882 [Pundamilia nyererei]
MASSLQIIRLITVAVSFLSVMGNKDRRVNMNCYNKPVNQTTFLGASATINCNYTRVKESGIKSFCREDASSYCNNLISSYDSNYTRLDRFSLRDDKQQRVYTVIISALTQQDAGKYQCSIKSGTSTSCLTEIHLYILNWDDLKPHEIVGVTSETATITYLVYHANVDFQKDTNVNLPADIVHYATVDFQKDERMLPVTSENGSTPMGQDVISPSADMLQYTTYQW